MARLKRKKQKQNNFANVRNSLLRITVLLVIIGLNWTGLSAVLDTFAYYTDTETSSGNIFQAGTLDFSIPATPDFSPSVTPTQSASRNISLINNGSLDFQYIASTTNAIGTLCNNLNLDANLDGGTTEYTGTLAGFSYNAGQFIASEDWVFTINLTSSDAGLQSQTCTFNFVFNGSQIGSPGFSDQEIISNTVTAGTWEAEEEITSNYSPIADAYVDQDHAGSNYGGNDELKIRSKDSGVENRRTFIRFDFNFPSGTNIVSSTLKLFMKDAPSASRTYEAKRVGSDPPRTPWTESGIKWNNQPTITSFTASTTSGTTNNVWLSWTVTSDVQSFVSGTSNYGWQLRDSVEGSETSYEAKFHSRESSDENKRPVLEMTFTPPEVTTTYPVINEVYYDVGSGKGDDPNNEWVEIYNPTDSAIDISGWKICEENNCDVISSISPIPAKGFAVASGRSSTWETYWTLPGGTITIDLPGDRIGGNGLRDDGDRVILKNASDLVIDAMSYGDDTSQLNPSVPLSRKGDSLARIVKGYDTNSATDWIINATPNPGTNPSIDGVETITFTYQGIEFLGGELAPEDDGVSNDLPEEEDIIEEDLIIEETSTSTENQEEGGIVEEINEIIDGIIDEIVEEIISDRSINEESTIEGETPTIDETTNIEEALPAEEITIDSQPPATEEQPAITPDSGSSQNEPAGGGDDSGGSDGSSGSGDGGGSAEN